MKIDKNKIPNTNQSKKIETVTDSKKAAVSKRKIQLDHRTTWIIIGFFIFCAVVFAVGIILVIISAV